MKIGKDGLSVAPPSNALLRRLGIFAKDLTIIVFVVSTYPLVEEGPGMVKSYWCPPIHLESTLESSCGQILRQSSTDATS